MNVFLSDIEASIVDPVRSTVKGNISTTQTELSSPQTTGRPTVRL